ncbi:MAG: YqiA/YcfP family alpha/beta fold hydrolase [Acidobacteriota bacterium]
MTPVRHVIYLHGFTSSPAATKAERFRRGLQAHGIGFSAPDFNLPDFATLTTTRMLDQVRAAIAAVPQGPIALVGASLGGFVALHAAAADATGRVDRLVLLAPALDFGGNRLREMGKQGIAEWRRRGRLPVFHYTYNEYREVGIELYEDAAQYDALRVPLSRPALVFQGTQDSIVSPEMVEAWARTQPTVTLRMLDDSHQMTQSIETIWAESETFLTGGRSRLPQS